MKDFSFHSSGIGNAGCEAVVTLLADPNCNLQYLNLNNENIDESVDDIFIGSLCNKSSISDTYFSNHTLHKLLLPHRLVENELEMGDDLAELLVLNENRNKSQVAIQKILLSHKNIDMEPLFEWDLSEEGEREGVRSLKALPYVIDWFRRAEDAVDGVNRAGYSGQIVEFKRSISELSSIYQFARAMPLLFEGIKSYDSKNNKRKRANTH